MQTSCITTFIWDLSILHQLGAYGKLPKLLKVIFVRWFFHFLGWIKFNMVGAVNGALGLGSCGGVFHTSRRFIKGYFAFSLDIVHFFDAELWIVIIAFDFAC